jgi:hypothetical protein
MHAAGRSPVRTKLEGKMVAHPFRMAAATMRSCLRARPAA